MNCDVFIEYESSYDKWWDIAEKGNWIIEEQNLLIMNWS